MTPEQWQRISGLFERAAQLHGDERSAYLREACDGQQELIDEVESLLAAHEEAGDFIHEPLVKDLADVSEMPTLTGKSILHYKIERSIGRGGMGDVYLAKDTRLDRLVALKRLPNRLAADPLFVKRFYSEARAVATIHHANVATIFSVEKEDGRPFITLEYVEGRSLDAVTPPEGLDLARFLEIFDQVTDALGCAHEKGVIHRDVKPGNIMIGSGDTVKILDFGLAQFADEGGVGQPEVTITQPGQILGTPSYMSPEQAQGKELDHRTDILSLGVVMYEALTGRRPFKGDNSALLISDLLKTDPVPVTELRDGIPDAIANLIHRCLEKKAGNRPQEMQDIADVLSKERRKMRDSTSTGSFARRLYQESRSVGVWARLAPVVLVLLLAILAWSYFSTGSPRPALNFENMTLRRLSQNNSVVYASITPDSRSLVFVQIADNGDRSLWIRRIDDNTTLQLLPPQPVEFWGGFAINSDSSQIFYITADRAMLRGTLYRISTLGGAPRKIAGDINDVGGLSPDGKTILYVRHSNPLRLYAANAEDGSGERVLQEADLSRTVLRDPHFSWDGSLIYYIRVDGRDTTEAWSVVSIPAGGGPERVVVRPQRERIHEMVVLKDGSGILINAVDAASNLFQLFHVAASSGVVTRITNDLNNYFGVTADASGKMIVSAQRRNERQIWLASLERSGLTGNHPISPDTNIDRTVAWTPDGRIVYCVLDNDVPHVWIASPDGKDRQQLTPSKSGDQQPIVSPDGRYIAFVSDRTGVGQIWRMNLDGSNQVQLSSGAGTAFYPHVGPDGKSVYFRWTLDDRRVMGKVPFNGGETTELPRYTENEWAFSPDGKLVAFAFVDADGKPKLKIKPVDGPGRESTLDVVPLSILKWRADGKALYLKERQPTGNNLSTISEVDIATGSSRVFFTVAPDLIDDFAISPDGKQIASIRGRLLTDAVLLTAADTK